MRLPSLFELSSGQMSRLTEALARLKAVGLRNTAPRRAMISALIKHPHPQTIEELHERVGPQCDLVTVYRSVGALHDAGLIRRLFSAEGTALVVLNSAPETFYAVQRETVVCALVEGVPHELFVELQRIEDCLRSKGYQNVSHLVQFFVDPIASGETHSNPIAPASTAEAQSSRAALRRRTRTHAR